MLPYVTPVRVTIFSSRVFVWAFDQATCTIGSLRLTLTVLRLALESVAKENDGIETEAMKSITM